MTISGRVLLIEDENSLRQTLTRILRSAGAEVTAAANGPEALQRLGNSKYDLVYLDIHLPEMNGLEVLREIQKFGQAMPVVLFTAHASLETAVEAMRLGATDYLLKPLNPEALLSRTEALLKRQSLERRRRELNSQITNLQDELRRLEGDPSVIAADKVVQVPVSDRFLKRGGLIVDLQARRTTFGEREVQLPPAAFDYLVVLTRHSPDVVDYQTLVTEAQGYQTDRREAQELAKWHIHELRDSLEPDPGNPRHVLNVRGVGYRLIVD
ncbi:MAG TPA: response regulator transcription factor [Anaerolineales bacterium]|nr:response regulator transcription factor [Anaerolineales bacterium]